MRCRIITRRVIPRAQTLYTSGIRASSSLTGLISNSIKATGPIPVSTYMHLCLGHPTHGYYMNRDPLGVGGDFITSPEISQLFGELVAIWFISALGALSPSRRAKPLKLVELGPGRGTLMMDMLRVITSLNMCPVHSVHLVETSPAMRSKQALTLERLPNPPSIQWHDHIDQVPDSADDAHVLIVANEFFDALPINVFEKARDGWHEVLVDNTPSHGDSLPESSTTTSTSKPTPFRFILSSTPVPVPAFNSQPRFSSLPVGTRVEYSYASATTMRRIAKLVSSGKDEAVGMALLVDYGGDHFYGGSFRAIKDHRIVSPLEEPGERDLTANVDFAALRDSLDGIPKVRTHGPASQREFLLHMGLEARLAGLMRGVGVGVGVGSDEREGNIKRLKDGAMKLIDAGPTGMGAKFQVLAVTSGLEVVYPWMRRTPDAGRRD